jgi:hypothetical protein
MSRLDSQQAAETGVPHPAFLLCNLPRRETVDYCLFPLPVHGKGVRGLGRPHTNWDPLFPFGAKIARERVLFSRRTGRELWKATALRPIPLAPFPVGKGGTDPKIDSLKGES